MKIMTDEYMYWFEAENSSVKILAYRQFNELTKVVSRSQ